MISGLNPKKMQEMMKKIGMHQEEISAKKVTIEKEDKTKIVIENPQVIKIKMAGQENFQISGEITEESENCADEQEIEQDISTIMEKTGKKDREEVALCLEKNNGDIAKTILELSEK